MNFKLEICVDNVQSAIDAQSAGASRVELCDNLIEGGTTPSYGTILLARQNLEIGLHVLIRPRAGDFIYSDMEFDIMRRDIGICGESGADGIVIGILRSDGTVDIERTSELAELARPMAVTFHRAFDMCSDPVMGLEEVIESGADILLTSGQMNNAADGSGLIGRLVKQAGERIKIMPGSGISASNIATIARVTKAKEFHLSAGKTIDSRMTFRKNGITMGKTPDHSEFTRKVTDPEQIKNIIRVLENL